MMCKRIFAIFIFGIGLLNFSYNCCAKEKVLDRDNYLSHPWQITMGIERKIFKVGEYKNIVLDIEWKNISDETISIQKNLLGFVGFHIRDKEGEEVRVMRHGVSRYAMISIPVVTLKSNETYSTKKELFFALTPLNLKPGKFTISISEWLSSKVTISSDSIEIELIPGEATELSDEQKGEYLWDEFNRRELQKLGERESPQKGTEP